MNMADTVLPSLNCSSSSSFSLVRLKPHPIYLRSNPFVSLDSWVVASEGGSRRSQRPWDRPSITRIDIRMSTWSITPLQWVSEWECRCCLPLLSITHNQPALRELAPESVTLHTHNLSGVPVHACMNDWVKHCARPGGTGICDSSQWDFCVLVFIFVCVLCVAHDRISPPPWLTGIILWLSSSRRWSNLFDHAWVCTPFHALCMQLFVLNTSLF